MARTSPARSARSTDLYEAHRRLGTLGATTPEHQPEPETGLIVKLDPAGHPLCLFEHPSP